MLRWLLGGRRKKQDNVDSMIGKRKALWGDPEDQFRRGKMIDAHMGNGNSVTDTTIALILVRFLCSEMTGEVSHRRSSTKLVNGFDEGSLKLENDLF